MKKRYPESPKWNKQNPPIVSFESASKVVAGGENQEEAGAFCAP
jgi:hypothetical protein